MGMDRHARGIQQTCGLILRQIPRRTEHPPVESAEGLLKNLLQLELQNQLTTILGQRFICFRFSVISF
jgi:hypothetical protein